MDKVFFKGTEVGLKEPPFTKLGQTKQQNQQWK